MGYGSINFNTSRRDYFLRCYLFVCDTKAQIDEGKAKSKAIFFGKYVNKERNTLAQLNQLFQNQESSLVIETQDNVDIKPNNYITIGQNIYRVIDTNKEPFYRNTQFMSRPYYITTINLQGV